MRPPGVDEWQVALLYDGGRHLPAVVLQERLAALAALHLDAGLPTALLVTCDPARIPAALPPRLLWCVERDLLSDMRALDTLCWHGALVGGHGQALPAALRSLGAYGRWGRAAEPATGHRVPYVTHPHLSVRASAVAACSDDLPLYDRGRLPSLVVHGLEWQVLAALGTHPLATRRQLARLCRSQDDRELRRVIGMGVAHGLLTVTVEETLPRHASQQRPAHRSTLLKHYALTPLGLSVLAQRHGLTVRRYQDLYHAIADTGQEDSRLSGAKHTLAHTRAVTDTYLALRDAATRVGARLTWWSEPVAWEWYAETLTDGHYLRPDARGALQRGQEHLSFYVEVDRRGTRHKETLETKVRQYYAYGAARGVADITLLVVTTATRVDLLLECEESAARCYRASPRLDLRVTTLASLEAGGVIGAIWRTNAAPGYSSLLGRARV